MPTDVSPNPFKPVSGAVRFTLKGAEYARAAASGAYIAGITALLAVLLQHIDVLPFDSETNAKIAAILGGVVALLQLVNQFFQHDDKVAPAPAPAPAAPTLTAPSAPDEY